MTNSILAFKGAAAIVTGAASGIGKAISEKLASLGCQVVLADIDADEVEQVAAEIRERGGQASAKYVDVTSFTEVNELVTQTIAEAGRLDYIFNNAGIGVVGEVSDHTIDIWDRIIAVNLYGVVNGVQAAYPEMIQQGFGHIVNTASMAGLNTSPPLTAYSMTKHAVVGLSKALRVEAQLHNVRVSALCPGVIRTPLLHGGKHGIFAMSVPEERQREVSSKFLGQLLPMDVSNFADKALDQVAHNRAIIILPNLAKVFWWLERLSPALGAYVARSMYGRYQKLLVTS